MQALALLDMDEALQCRKGDLMAKFGLPRLDFNHIKTYLEKRLILVACGGFLGLGREQLGSQVQALALLNRGNGLRQRKADLMANFRPP